MSAPYGDAGLTARERWEQGRPKSRKTTRGGKHNGPRGTCCSCVWAVLRCVPDCICTNSLVPQPKELKRNNCWCLYRGCCNFLVAFALFSGFAYCAAMLYRQSSQQIRTPQIALMQMMPMTLPSVENWKLQLLCQMRFVNGGDRNFTLSSFLGDFEYQDLTGLGVFELQPEDVPFTLRPQETKYVLARLTMHDHLPHIKARLTTGLIAEWIGKKNPVLKLRTQTIGLVWAWDTMVQFQAEYLCRYTLYVAKHGLGLVDFSNWTLAQERWQDALSKGQAKADEGLVAFERTKVDGEILDPLYFFAGVATACMVCICLICCCASCYPCYFPAQHGSTSEWTSLALVICFGNRILAWQLDRKSVV